MSYSNFNYDRLLSIIRQARDNSLADEMDRTKPIDANFIIEECERLDEAVDKTLSDINYDGGSLDSCITAARELESICEQVNHLKDLARANRIYFG